MCTNLLRRLARTSQPGCGRDPMPSGATGDFTDAEVRAVVEASLAVDPDFGDLVLVLAATGCRFSRAAALTVTTCRLMRGEFSCRHPAKVAP